MRAFVSLAVWVLVLTFGARAEAERTEIAVTASDVTVQGTDPFELIFAVDLPALSAQSRLDFAMLEMELDVEATGGAFVPFVVRVVPADLAGAAGATAVSTAVPGEALVSRAGARQRVRIDVTRVVRECMARGEPHGMAIAVEAPAEAAAEPVVAVSSGSTVARVRLFMSRR
ncbi:MAG: hypothetical protein OEO21_04580 [Candidatus Krumholzibacteria bacterium]|nr:hypothetical protein [Candidatus Krumholzibacteria bacterium]